MACLARDDKPGICDARVAVALPDRGNFAHHRACRSCGRCRFIRSQAARSFAHPAGDSSGGTPSSLGKGQLAFIVPSGLMMFTAHATEFATNPAFQLKLTLLAAAAANAIAFHLRTFRTVTAWDRGAPAPPAAKVAAILSLLLWSGVIVCGRLLAYL